MTEKSNAPLVSDCCECDAESVSYTLPDATIELVAVKDLRSRQQV